MCPRRCEKGGKGGRGATEKPALILSRLACSVLMCLWLAAWASHRLLGLAGGPWDCPWEPCEAGWVTSVTWSKDLQIIQHQQKLLIASSLGILASLTHNPPALLSGRRGTRQCSMEVSRHEGACLNLEIRRKSGCLVASPLCSGRLHSSRIRWLAGVGNSGVSLFLGATNIPGAWFSRDSSSNSSNSDSNRGHSRR